MPMSYTSLLADKGTPGSAKNWIGYSKIDVVTALEEAQSLIFTSLRVREMRSEWVFGMAVGHSAIALPDRFLDPMGKIRDVTNNLRLSHRDAPVLQDMRVYDSTVTGTLPTDPFTTVLGSSLVSVSDPNHGLTQESTVTYVGVATVGGLNLNATFPVIDIEDANSYVINVGDVTATSTATGGGASITWTADRLQDGTAGRWGIWDEKVHFDVACEQPTQFKLNYFRSPVLLSSSNPTNFLTNRYSRLIRIAINAAAAEQMKDDEEFNKMNTLLGAAITKINQENDMFMRGMDIETDTPTPGDYY